MTGDLAAELAKGYVRLNMALLVLLFGPDDARRQVERLYDGKLPADQAHAVREGLDAMARKWRQA